MVAVGFLLGGTVGIGTIAYALAIGPLAQFFLPMLTVRSRRPPPPGPRPEPSAPALSAAPPPNRPC